MKAIGQAAEKETSDGDESETADGDDGDDEVTYTERVLDVGGEEGGGLTLELVEAIQERQHRNGGRSAGSDAGPEAHRFLAHAWELLVGTDRHLALRRFGLDTRSFLVEERSGQVGSRGLTIRQPLSPPRN